MHHRVARPIVYGAAPLAPVQNCFLKFGAGGGDTQCLPPPQIMASLLTPSLWALLDNLWAIRDDASGEVLHTNAPRESTGAIPEGSDHRCSRANHGIPPDECTRGGAGQGRGGRTVRCAIAVRVLCEKWAILDSFPPRPRGPP